MKAHWRTVISYLPLGIQKKVYNAYSKKLHKEWLTANKPVPPSHWSKQEHLRYWAKKNNLYTLIETGTYLGDMVFALQDDFSKIISIELAEVFYEKASKRFRAISKINILQGDSGNVLQKVISEIQAPTLIWLDGHYSGGLTAKGEKECPVYEELDAIFSTSYDHTVLIDDARLFVGKNDYPTVDELMNFVSAKKPSYHILQDNDAIIITPNV